MSLFLQAERKGHVRTNEEGAIYKPGTQASPETNPDGILILNFQLPGMWENKFLLFKLASL